MPKAMSTPKPSMKSSVGSKSTDLDLALYHDERGRALSSSWVSRLGLPPSHPRPRSASTATAGDALDRPPHTISTDESRTPASITSSALLARRCLTILAPPKPLPDREPARRLIAGFGPFQVRTVGSSLPRRASGNLYEGNDSKPGVGSVPFYRRIHKPEDDPRKLKSVATDESWDNRRRFSPQSRGADNCASVHLSPFFVFRPPPPGSGYLSKSQFDNDSLELAGNRGVPGPIMEVNTVFRNQNIASSSLNQNIVRPVNEETHRPPFTTSYLPSQATNEPTPHSPFEWHLHGGPCIASTSAQHVHGSRSENFLSGAVYRDGAEDTTTCRGFGDAHPLHYNTIPRCSEKQPTSCLKEPEQPFSYWNVGRFKRKNTVTLVSPTSGLTRNLDMKRNSNADDFISIKWRKLGKGD